MRKPTNCPPGGGVVTDRMMRRDVVIVHVTLVHMGELSAARRASEAAPLAPGTMATLRKLTDPERRPPVAREELCQEVVDAVPERPFQLDSEEFLVCLRKARRGAAAGVMTAFGQNRIWPKKSEFGQFVFVTAFGQTAFGQN